MTLSQFATMMFWYWSSCFTDSTLPCGLGCPINALRTKDPLASARHCGGVGVNFTAVFLFGQAFLQQREPQYEVLQDKTPELYENAMAMLNLCEAAMATWQGKSQYFFRRRGLACCTMSRSTRRVLLERGKKRQALGVHIADSCAQIMGL